MNALLVAAQGGVLLVFTLMGVLYHLLAPWWRYPMGRLIMALDFSVVGFAASGLASLAWPDYPGRLWVLLSLRAVLLWVGGWLICQLAVAQAYGEMARRRPERNDDHVQ